MRARELINFDGTPGKYNSITDVDDVEVGHSTIINGNGKEIRSYMYISEMYPTRFRNSGKSLLILGMLTCTKPCNLTKRSALTVCLLMTTCLWW